MATINNAVKSKHTPFLTCRFISMMHISKWWAKSEFPKERARNYIVKVRAVWEKNRVEKKE